MQNHPPEPQRKTKEERAARFMQLMDENGWNQADAAQQRGLSRARVTQILNSLKIPKA